jgi:hypothetical protein
MGKLWASFAPVRFKLMGDMNLVFALQRRLAYLAPFTLSLSKGIFSEPPILSLHARPPEG